MPRNLDHRIEVVVPVLDAKLQQELNAVFDVALADDSSAWVLGTDGSWERLQPAKPGKGRAAQAALMRRARTRARPRNGIRRR